MNAWDDKAREAADNADTALPLDRATFVAGARWQREQLLPDEAVERAARTLYESDREPDAGDEPWGDLHDSLREYYTDSAHMALRAVVEGEQS